ncbi:hypothetical protein NQ176_g3432 [Zarea fungicola]|uniref:Uncharacterized protein n=1 Tax=Zarea fungicola TaxID=93591 RepID=A0ACC1NKT9_9HYPO|nr:hypothetical protein NQ176_g3432 [Lecanicillium fungicola]
MGSHLVVIALLPLLAAAVIIPFPVPGGSNGFGSDGTISQTCAVALNSTINCDADLATLARANSYISPNSTGKAAALCAPACSTALTAYHNNVVSKCGSAPLIDPLLQNSFMGDLFQAYFQLICTTDPASGQYCVGMISALLVLFKNSNRTHLSNMYLYFNSADFLNKGFGAAGAVSSWSAFPKSLICSSCEISWFQAMQKSPFLGYNLDTEQNWQATQKICGITSPAGVDPGSILRFPPDPPSSPVTANATCASGNTYTVKKGDTCSSIAVANSVAQGTLWGLNNLGPDCSNMAIGQSLCLPAKCTLYTLAAGDTCWSVATAKGISFSALLGYNPAISPDCSNLNATGSVICVSNPQGNFVPLPANGTDPNSQQQYATATAAAPGPTPFGTTSQCGTFYQAQVADTCQRISVAAGISVSLFEQINPSIDSNCFNLIPGLWYCVQPTPDWNTTVTGNTTSTPVPAPAPTPSGTVSTCYKWHVIVSGDTCSTMQQTLGVTIQQLILWNPSLLADCSNLLQGEAYCISGPMALTTTGGGVSTRPATTTSAAQSTSKTIATGTTTTAKSSSVASSTTLAPPAPTTPGTTSSCSKWHVVVSGEGCPQIEQAFGITIGQLVIWNPSLKSDCTNLLLGVAYCVAGPPPATTGVQPAPAPTPPGTTANCSKWHVIASGDGCPQIEQTFGITITQLVTWNPNLKADCTNLLLGEAYCVAGL